MTEVTMGTLEREPRYYVCWQVVATGKNGRWRRHYPETIARALAAVYDAQSRRRRYWVEPVQEGE